MVKDSLADLPSSINFGSLCSAFTLTACEQFFCPLEYIHFCFIVSVKVYQRIPCSAAFHSFHLDLMEMQDLRCFWWISSYIFSNIQHVKHFETEDNYGNHEDSIHSTMLVFIFPVLLCNIIMQMKSGLRRFL